MLKEKDLDTMMKYFGVDVYTSTPNNVFFRGVFDEEWKEIRDGVVCVDSTRSSLTIKKSDLVPIGTTLNILSTTYVVRRIYYETGGTVKLELEKI